ncbi:MAG TPA: sigma-70 family RNA polymerase sigma factor [Tepidisphaeraceae bacterium]
MNKSPKPKPAYIDNPAFHAPDAADTLFPLSEPLPPLPPVFHITYDFRKPSTPATNAPTTDEERRWFLQFNYARLRVAQGDGGEAALWSRRAAHMEELIARRNLPLVAFAYGVDRSRLTRADFDDVFSHGMAALLRCIRAFDVAKGFKFSTFTVVSVRRAFGGANMKAAKHGQRAGWRTDISTADAIASLDDYNGRESVETADYLGELLEANVAELNPNQQKVLALRFGLNGGDRLTLDEVGDVLGVTRERVRQIQLRALLKLREALSPLLLVK